MSTGTLAGHRLTAAKAHLPAWGIWWAEASLDEEVSLSGRVALAIADLQLSGTIMSGGVGPKGRSSYRIAAGAGGWGKSIVARSYSNDAGVKASTVLLDAASACGETIDESTLPTNRLGPAFVREAGPAARVLEQLASGGWYVAEDGRTKIGRRPKTTVTGQMQVSAVDLSRRTVSLAAESIAALLPGAVVEDVEAVDVRHELTPGALRTKLWGAGITSSSRDLELLRRLLEQLDPDRRFRGTYEYRVVTQFGARLYLQPIRVSAGMPDLQRVTVRPGIPGARGDVALGSSVLVTFVDADPARPVVVAFEDAEGGGFQPGSLELGTGEAVLDVVSAAAGRFVRYGDPCITFPGGVATPGVLLPAPAPTPGTLSTVRSG